MKRRNLVPLVMEALSDTPIVFIQGPRQSGKTTLVQMIRNHGYEADYVSLDDAATLANATMDPDGFIRGLPERVILDEVHRSPAILLAIKRSVDINRKPGRFLLTGSADVMTLPKVADSLAGRVEHLQLWPLSQGEIEDRREAFIDCCFGEEFKPGPITQNDWRSLVDRIVVGGFPEALARPNPTRRSAWFASYVSGALHREVEDVANIHVIRELPTLLRLIAARAASILNMTGLARDAHNTPRTSMSRYLAILETIFFVQTLPCWSTNFTSRLTKPPKIVVTDSGLLCHVLGIDRHHLLSDGIMSGQVFENFVITELVRQSGWCQTKPRFYHYRSKSMEEVDLVLEDRRGRVVGIEIKKTSSPSANDFKGLRALADKAGKNFYRGILLYTGTEIIPSRPNTYAVPISTVWNTT
jgi:uncharacterized protein